MVAETGDHDCDRGEFTFGAVYEYLKMQEKSARAGSIGSRGSNEMAERRSCMERRFRLSTRKGKVYIQ